MGYVDEQIKRPDYNSEFEMPYYKWEADLHVTGNQELTDNAQGYFFEGFRGLASFTKVPNENRLMHVQIKK
jgi:hypothetical protein